MLWSETRLAIPALRAAAWQTTPSARFVIGLIGFSPGKADLWPCDPPPVAQQLQQLRREHRMRGSAAVAMLDTQQHALVVDVRHFNEMISERAGRRRRRR